MQTADFDAASLWRGRWQTLKSASISTFCGEVMRSVFGVFESSDGWVDAVCRRGSLNS